MHDEFEMSMMEELNFFLGLQIKQMEDEIFFNQSKFIREMLKKFRLEDSKPTKTPMSTEIKLTKDDEADSVDSFKYQGCCLTSWFAKKQTALAISMTEAEYVSAGKACQQALWMKQALIDYNIRLDDPATTATTSKKLFRRTQKDSPSTDLSDPLCHSPSRATTTTAVTTPSAAAYSPHHPAATATLYTTLLVNINTTSLPPSPRTPSSPAHTTTSPTSPAATSR
nr:copia protein [Tanacetum cinerariifolium]